VDGPAPGRRKKEDSQRYKDVWEGVPKNTRGTPRKGVDEALEIKQYLSFKRGGTTRLEREPDAGGISNVL